MTSMKITLNNQSRHPNLDHGAHGKFRNAVDPWPTPLDLDH
jgi:hypothetical protein